MPCGSVTATGYDNGYQGGENDAVIFDFVRSNDKGRIGFIKDLRRLNVGLSRGKENLAIVWDSRTLTKEPRSQSSDDRLAREFFRAIESYYQTEVQPFFPGLEKPSANGRDARLTIQPFAVARDALSEWFKAQDLTDLAWAARTFVGLVAAVVESTFTPLLSLFPKTLTPLWASLHAELDRSFARESVPMFQLATESGLLVGAAWATAHPVSHWGLVIVLSVYLTHAVLHTLLTLTQELSTSRLICCAA